MSGLSPSGNRRKNKETGGKSRKKREIPGSFRKEAERTGKSGKIFGSGPKGRGFESRHFDSKAGTPSGVSVLLSSCREFDFRWIFLHRGGCNGPGRQGPVKISKKICRNNCHPGHLMRINIRNLRFASQWQERKEGGFDNGSERRIHST